MGGMGGIPSSASVRSGTMIERRGGPARELSAHTFRGSWWTRVAGRCRGRLLVLLARLIIKSKGFGREDLGWGLLSLSVSGCERQEVKLCERCRNTGCLRILTSPLRVNVALRCAAAMRALALM